MICKNIRDVLDNLEEDYDSPLTYYLKHKDELLDTEFAKDDQDKYENINMIRLMISYDIERFAETLDQIYMLLVYGYYQVKERFISKDDYTYHLKYLKTILDESFIDIKIASPEEIELITDQVRNQSGSESLLCLLDEYDLKYNKEKFLFPNFVLDDCKALYYFVSKYIFENYSYYDLDFSNFLDLDKEDE